MSAIFRSHRTTQTMASCLATLARLAHQAEDTGDDMLLLAVVDEIESRGMAAELVYMAEYRRLMVERNTPRHGPAPRSIPAAGTSPSSGT